MRAELRKWRPSLWLVTAGALGGVLALSLVGLVVFRYLGPVSGFKLAAGFVGGVIALATAVLWGLMLRLLIRPIADLSRFAKGVTNVEADNPEPQHFGTAEMFVVGSDVVAMADSLKNRAETVRSFTNHVTHELKTPVATLKAATEVLIDSSDLSASDRELAEQLRAAADQMAGQLDALRATAAAKEARYLGETGLDDLRQIAQAFEGQAEISVEGQGVLPISPEGMEVILHHLISNAIAHGAGRVSVEFAGSEDMAYMAVANDGDPISEGNASRLFDPFFTTRRGEGGTGMGLAIVDDILSAHQGSVRYAPDADGKVRFEVGFRV
ncbi:MAG: HAMP domain-containing sensor histidine kinase [Pseudomonadota bacterium]